MTYTLNKTDGTILTNIVDGTIDQTTTSLTLIGKNATAYGQFIDQNFVNLLENFANSSQPNFPITGQLWFDTSQNRLKVYNGNSFGVAGGTIVSPTVPTLTQGDIWVDSYRKQLYFNDGTGTFLAGPIYTQQQGVSGFNIVDILDTNGISHTVALVYVAQVLIGLYSKDSFTPGNNQIPGFSGSVVPGFNAGNAPGILTNSTATVAKSLLASDGSLKTAESFISTSQNSTTFGTITIANATPLILGPNSNNEILISPVTFTIDTNSINQNFQINTFNSSGKQAAFYINANNRYIGINTTNPAADLDVAGNAVIRGNLTVNGSVTTVTNTAVTVAEKYITLAATATPTDTTADGSGIIIEGTTNKSLLWSNSFNAWNSSENINIPGGKAYYINGISVLSSTSLGSNITAAPGLTSIGTLNTLQAAELSISNSTISFYNVSLANGTITISPKGTGTVDFTNNLGAQSRLTNVATPTSPTDGANKAYVDYATSYIPLAFSADTTGLSDSTIASTILTKIFPPTEHQNGTILRMYTTQSGVVYYKLFTIVSGAWQFTQNF